MQKFTEKIHSEIEKPEIVWLKQEEKTNLKTATGALEAIDEVETTNKTKFMSELFDGVEENSATDDLIPIVYSKHYEVNFLKLEKLHPFDAHKGTNIVKYLLESNTFKGRFYEPEEITKADLLTVHTPRYLTSLKWSLNVAKISEVPLLMFMPNCCVQKGYLKPMRYQTAGSILAGKLALNYGWSINLGGGFHHCYATRGGGFCPYADITLLIRKIFSQETTIKRIMIVDLDAHQGNGHERDFLNDEQVYIMDMYNMAIYPRDSSAKLAIHYSVELDPHTEDSVYLKKLKLGLNISLEKFHPQLVVYNAGTDILQGDPLGLLSISPQGVIKRDGFVFAACRSLKIPIVMLLSGGYLKSSAKIIADSITNLKTKGLLVNSN